MARCENCDEPLDPDGPQLGVFEYRFCDDFCANEWMEDAARTADE
jgi:hypothetical protein